MTSLQIGQEVGIATEWPQCCWNNAYSATTMTYIPLCVKSWTTSLHCTITLYNWSSRPIK